jgi:hypothetical protein
LDFQRTFPPEAPADGAPMRSFLYRLLRYSFPSFFVFVSPSIITLHFRTRPEFVSKYPRPLSSDAFSGFGKYDSESHVHNAEVRDATEYLQKKLVPRFAVFLESLDKKKLKTLRLNEILHREGINVRLVTFFFFFRHISFLTSLLFFLLFFN